MFYVNNLDVRQSRQANDSASIESTPKKEILQLQKLEKAQQEVKGHDYQEFESADKLFLSA